MSKIKKYYNIMEIPPEKDDKLEIPLDRNMQRAKDKGRKKLPEFEKFFPQGMNYEVYTCSWRVQCSKCDVPEEGINYLAQSTQWLLRIEKRGIVFHLRIGGWEFP